LFFNKKYEKKSQTVCSAWFFSYRGKNDWKNDGKSLETPRKPEFFAIGFPAFLGLQKKQNLLY